MNESLFMKFGMLCWALLLSMLVQAQNQDQHIDAACVHKDSLVYFFNKEHVYVYDWKIAKLIVKKSLKRSFPGIPFNQIDAAFVQGADTLVLLSQNCYIRFDLTNNIMLDRFPSCHEPHAAVFKERSHLKYNWTTDRPQAVVALDASRLYLFASKAYYAYDVQAKTMNSDYPKTISPENWPSIQFDEVDAAFRVADKLYLVRGQQMLAYHSTTNQPCSVTSQQVSMLDDMFSKLDAQKELDKRTASYIQRQDLGAAYLYKIMQGFQVFSDTLNGQAVYVGKHIALQSDKALEDADALYLWLSLLDSCWQSFQQLSPHLSADAAAQHYFKGRYLLRYSSQTSCEQFCAQPEGGLYINSILQPFDLIQQQLKAENPLELAPAFFSAIAHLMAQNNAVISLDNNTTNSSVDLWNEIFTELSRVYWLPSVAALPVKDTEGQGTQAASIRFLGQYMRDAEQDYTMCFDLKQSKLLPAADSLLLAIFHYIHQNFGREKAYKRMLEGFSYLDKPNTVQDLMDNYYVLACFAAKRDLRALFEKQFKIQLSDKIIQKLRAIEKGTFSHISD